jgi:hypothetical protein
VVTSSSSRLGDKRIQTRVFIIPPLKPLLNPSNRRRGQKKAGYECWLLRRVAELAKMGARPHGYTINDYAPLYCFDIPHGCLKIILPKAIFEELQTVSLLSYGYHIFAHFRIQIFCANSPIPLIGTVQSGFLHAAEKRFSYSGDLADVVEFGVHLVSIGSESWETLRKLNLS